MKTIGHITIEGLQHFINNSIETDQVPDKMDKLVLLADLIEDYNQLSLPQGSVILVQVNNSKLFISHVFAISLAGYVPALVPPSTPNARVNLIANSFKARAIVKNKVFSNSIINSSKPISIAGLEVALIDQDKAHTTMPGEVILTTSGTSGFSSGCVFDFSALLRNAQKHADVIHLSNHDKVLVNLPMYYSYAFVAQTLATLVSGAKLIISAPPFNTARYLDDINHFSITVSAITPLIVKDLVNNRVKIGPSMRVMSVGGDKLPEETLHDFLHHSFDKELYLTYGISEAGPRVATLAVHNEPKNRWGSVGKLLPNTKARLLDSDHASGHKELLIHSDTLVKYRLGNTTKPLFIELDGEKWLRTGDLFHIDEDGYLFYKDRLSDFIVLSGEKVNLADIKRHVTTKTNALSTKICLIKDKTEITGFGLDILIPPEATINSESLLKSLNRELKVYERPRFIEVTHANEKSTDRYK